MSDSSLTQAPIESRRWAPTGGTLHMYASGTSERLYSFGESVFVDVLGEHDRGQQTGAGWRTVGREDSAVVTCCVRVGRGGIMMVLVVVVPGKTLVP